MLGIFEAKMACHMCELQWFLSHYECSELASVIYQPSGVQWVCELQWLSSCHKCRCSECLCSDCQVPWGEQLLPSLLSVYPLAHKQRYESVIGLQKCSHAKVPADGHWDLSAKHHHEASDIWPSNTLNVPNTAYLTSNVYHSHLYKYHIHQFDSWCRCTSLHMCMCNHRSHPCMCRHVYMGLIGTDLHLTT